LITFEDVTKVFGTGETAVAALDRFSFHLPRGEFWALMGPSGSGKSTVLHLVSGLTQPTSGRIVVDGVDIATLGEVETARLRRTRVGYVLQTFNLLPFLTATENVAMPLVLDGVAAREIDKRVREVLEQVEMGHRAVHKPSELSGGEQQRVAIARALVIRPAIVLADEPTGNLDRAAGRGVIELIQDINERTGVTVLMVTHDPSLAAASQRILRLVDGRLDQEIALEDGAEATIPDRSDGDST
jgi:putative ABC transport system ATP-binding protein